MKQATAGHVQAAGAYLDQVNAPSGIDQETQRTNESSRGKQRKTLDTLKVERIDDETIGVLPGHGRPDNWFTQLDIQVPSVSRRLPCNGSVFPGQEAIEFLFERVWIRDRQFPRIHRVKASEHVNHRRPSNPCTADLTFEFVT
jgi:hypothetical protein